MQYPHETDRHQFQKPTKDYIELTTGSLLARRKQRQRLGRHLSAGSFLLVLPDGYHKHLGFFKRLARTLREAGRDVEIHTI